MLQWAPFSSNLKKRWFGRFEQKNYSSLVPNEKRTGKELIKKYI